METLSDPIAPAPDIPEPRCIRCGYNLRGIGEVDRCPECGSRAYWSLRAPKRLSEYPPGWVASISWATRLLLLVYAALATMFLLGFLGAFENHTNFAGIALTLAAIVQLIAMWMLAQRTQHWSEPRAPLNRLTLLLAPIGPVFATAAGLCLNANVDIGLSQATLAQILYVGMCGWVLALPAVFVRLRALARMISNARLVEHSVIVACGMLLSSVGLAILTAVSLRFGGNIMANLTYVVVMLFVCTALILFLIWGAIIMSVCVIDFGRAARIARETWMHDAPSL